MDVKKKCLDTYALIELIRGNVKFIHLFSQDFVIPTITLIEFYGVLLREEGKQTAEHWFKKLEPYTIQISLSIMKNATIFRYENKKQNLFFFDCVGYIFARENNMKFVTGDKEFKNKEGVEFIQK